MRSKLFFIAGLALAVCLAAALPYIDLMQEERGVAEYNAGHVERMEQYRKDLAEYEARLARRPKIHTILKGENIPDGLLDIPPQEPLLMEFNGPTPIFKGLSLLGCSILLAFVTLTSILSAYYMYIYRKAI